MSDLTNYGENQAATALLGSGTFYVSLHTGNPGETGAANELAAANGYARQSVTFSVAGAVASSDATVTFGPATADQGTITHFALWDAASGGNSIAYGALAASRAWSSGTLEAAAGAFTLTMD